MDEDPQLWKLKYEDLNNFEFFEKYAFTIPFVKDSVEYLLTIRYKFENYITEKLHSTNKKTPSPRIITTTETKGQPITRENYREIVNLEKIKSIDLLNKNEVLFYEKLNNLIRLQINRMRLHQELSGINIRNQINYGEQEQILLDDIERKENLIWLGTKDQLVLLINELEKNNYFDSADKEKIVRLFRDSSGKSFNRIKKEMVKWQGKKTELSMLIKGLSNGANKLLANEHIWVKTAKCFFDENGMQLNPSRLAVAYQKGQPKTKEVLNNIIKTIKSLEPTI